MTLAISFLNLGELDVSGNPISSANFGWDIGYDLDDWYGEFDGPGGIDNAFARGEGLQKLMALINFGGYPGGPSQKANGAILQGRLTTLFHFENLGSAASQNALRARAYAGAPRSAEPSWDGTDIWPVSDASVLDASIDDPSVHFDESYVVDGTWVSGAPSKEPLLITLWPAWLTLRIHRPIVTLRLTGAWPDIQAEDGIVAGAVDAHEVAAELARVDAVCGYGIADIAANVFEFGGPDVPLDPELDQGPKGVSFGLAFRARRVQLGGISAATDGGPNGCLQGPE